ncbi:uncharacterized protein PV06_07075 [Exophiala oligosperma]|uniref:Uncharacterized protein n=1 Tax=Exophiala oligosperma TaxID=215243 RepID=A0A0D2DGM6_9EURO|nr:uncharacterized protein PV06_07075 [Exophiala oligosperma]KIW41525.1 hypothetical protein PV06_07075 [Exophiala oligosperma]
MFDMAEPVEAMTASKTAHPNEGSVSSVSGDGAAPQPTEGTMHKRFTFLSLWAFFLAGTAGWEAIAASLFQVVIGGGPPALVWGFVLNAVAAVCIASSMAEFASIWPTAAGQYHWVVAMAPKEWKTVMGWFSAWVLLLMNILSSLSALFAGALSLQACVSLAHESYTPQRWQTYMIILAIIAFALTINVFIPRALHHLSLLGTVTHVCGFFIVIIILLATTDHKNSARTVFVDLENFTGWPTNAAAFLIGVLPTSAGFSTLDMPVRYSEETSKPQTDVSRALFWGVLASATIGLPFVLVLAFCMGDPEELLQGSVVHLSPLAQIIYNSTHGNIHAANGIACLIVIVAIISATDCMGGLSRIIMAQSRDGAFPFGHALEKISPRWNTPVGAIMTAATIQAMLAVIYIGNSTAFFGFLSGVFTLQVLSYGTPIFLHLIRRKTLNLTYGPWRLPYRWGWIVNVLGLTLYGLLFVAVSLPTSIPVTAENMNYASPIAGMVLILSAILWFAWGRRVYDGPRISLEVLVGSGAVVHQTDNASPIKAV